MSSFTDELTLTQLSGDGLDWHFWRLEQHLVYHVGGVGTGRAVVIAPGFVTDGPSIPRFLWALLPVWGRWSRAGLLHDYLCCLIALGHPHPAAPDRNGADAIFLEAMRVLGVGWLARTLLYLGVRLGTWFDIKTTMYRNNKRLAAVVEAASDLG